MKTLGFLGKSGWRATGVRPQVMNILTTEVPITECRNILWMPEGTIAPRSPENLKKLYRYIRRKFGRKNIFDKRTRAYRYLKSHDSEVARDDK